MGKSGVGTILIAMVIASACNTSAAATKYVRPAYAVRNQTLYSFASESSSLVVRTWNPVAKRSENEVRVKGIAESPIAVINSNDNRFFLLALGQKGKYAIYVLEAAKAASSLGSRLLWRGDASGELLLDLIQDRESLVVVGRQKVYYLEHDRPLKYLGPGPEKVFRMFSSVAGNGNGRIAINEDSGFVEYDIAGGQLVERCRLQAGQFAVSAVAHSGDGWTVLGSGQATGLRIFSMNKCEASPLSDPLAPGKSWVMASTGNTSVFYAPGQSQPIVFVAAGHGVERVELPFAPEGLLFPSDGPKPSLFFVGESGVSTYRAADQ